MYFITYGNKIAFILPCGIWNSAPNLCAKEWFIPKNAFVNAIPAIVLALCIFSLANLFVPSSYACSRYVTTNSDAFSANPSV